MERHYYIYRYKDIRDGSVLYIGKTKRDLSQRIKEHGGEPKFRQYLPYADISYYEVDGGVKMDIHEKYWIHTLMPPLNVVDKVLSERGVCLGFDPGKVRWKRYADYEATGYESRLVGGRKEAALQGFGQLVEKDRLWENAGGFLEYCWEQYLSDSLDVSGSEVTVVWDLDAYPLPDMVVLEREDGSEQVFAFYIRAERFDSGLYLLRHRFPDFKRLLQDGRKAVVKNRRLLAGERLSLEERHGWDGDGYGL